MQANIMSHGQFAEFGNRVDHAMRVTGRGGNDAHGLVSDLFFDRREAGVEVIIQRNRYGTHIKVLCGLEKCRVR